MNRTFRANMMLLTAALIWGVAFVPQGMAMDSMPPFSFNGIRMLLAGLTLMVCIALIRRRDKTIDGSKQDPHSNKFCAPSVMHTTVLPGCLCGLILFVASSFQQLGLQDSTPGKAGFITALYIVLVPLVGLFRGKKIGPRVWLAVALSALGLFFLCVTSELVLGSGDVYLILCAFCFTGHILVIDHFAPGADCMKMSCIQFFVTGTLATLVAALFEKPTLGGVRQAIFPILYTGSLSGAVGYTLQMLGQRDTSPTVASLLMCLESVFAVLAGWILLKDALSPRELLGCALMLAGIVLAQFPLSRDSSPHELPAYVHGSEEIRPKA